jgi:hypothetical protein
LERKRASSPPSSRRIVMKRRIISIISTTWIASLTALTPSWAAQALASDTGRPSEILDKKCTDYPVVSVCVMNQTSENLPQLEITYRGYLKAAEYNGVVAWISLNGKTGFFHMQAVTSESSSGKAVVWIGTPKSEYQCIIGSAVAPEARPSGLMELPKCPPGTSGEPGELHWIYEPPAEEEAALLEGLHPAEGDYPPWKIELAFVSVDGRRWDSRYGANYQFLFKTVSNP